MTLAVPDVPAMIHHGYFVVIRILLQHQICELKDSFSRSCKIFCVYSLFIVASQKRQVLTLLTTRVPALWKLLLWGLTTSSWYRPASCLQTSPF